MSLLKLGEPLGMGSNYAFDILIAYRGILLGKARISLVPFSMLIWVFFKKL